MSNVVLTLTALRRALDEEISSANFLGDDLVVAPDLARVKLGDWDFIVEARDTPGARRIIFCPPEDGRLFPQEWGRAETAVLERAFAFVERSDKPPITIPPNWSG